MTDRITVEAGSWAQDGTGLNFVSFQKERPRHDQLLC